MFANSDIVVFGTLRVNLQFVSSFTTVVGIRNAVALRDACYVRVSSRVPDVLGLPGLSMEDNP